MRFKANSPVHLKADGTPDMRYKANRSPSKADADGNVGMRSKAENARSKALMNDSPEQEFDSVMKPVVKVPPGITPMSASVQVSATNLR